MRARVALFGLPRFCYWPNGTSVTCMEFSRSCIPRTCLPRPPLKYGGHVQHDEGRSDEFMVMSNTVELNNLYLSKLDHVVLHFKDLCVVRFGEGLLHSWPGNVVWPTISECGLSTIFFFSPVHWYISGHILYEMVRDTARGTQLTNAGIRSLDHFTIWHRLHLKIDQRGDAQ